MSEKKWLIILGIINVLAMAGIVFWYINRDHTPPVITQEEEIVYQETMNYSELLQGLTAMDETDGDVSYTLVVEKVLVNHNMRSAVVTCGAVDSSGNIAKQAFRMTMKENPASASESEAEAVNQSEVFTLTVGEAANGSEIEAAQNEEMTENRGSAEDTNGNIDEADTEENNNSEDTADAENEENGENSEEPDGDEEQEAPAENTNEAAEPAANEQQAVQEAPILSFSAPEVKTKKGYNPAWVSVIAQLQDNKDNYEFLLQNLKIAGEFTNATVGSYDVMVSTVDSDGNESAARAIRITVEE